MMRAAVFTLCCVCVVRWRGHCTGAACGFVAALLWGATNSDVINALQPLADGGFVWQARPLRAMVILLTHGALQMCDSTG